MVGFTVGFTYPGLVVLTVDAPSLQTYVVAAGAVLPVNVTFKRCVDCVPVVATCATPVVPLVVFNTVLPAVAV